MKRAKPEFQNNFSYLLKLLSCVLNDTTPPEPNDDTDWASVFSMAEYHDVTGMVYCAVNKLPKELRPHEDILMNPREQYQIGMVRDINIDIETEKLLFSLGKEGIKVLPLKGYVLKKDYPEASLRTMTDVDILFDSSQKAKAREILSAGGYRILSDTEEELDVFKEPFHHYEFHSVLDTTGRFTCHFFENAMEHGRFDENNRGILSADDFYIYMIEHFAKHMEAGGAGIRMVMDIYVFLKNHKSELSEEYLEKTFTELKLQDFRKVSEELAYNWFSPQSEPETDSLVADYILCSCTFGKTSDAIIIKNLRDDKRSGKKSSAVKNIFRRIIPGFNFIANQYPVTRKCKVLYPFMIPMYWIRRIFKSKNVTTVNFRHYLKTSDSEEAVRLTRIMRELGLESRL
ncbi:MAG: nucleotidyltransferase family protein [Ruminococcus sp.]|nr:nucleotidyltransferase family protein [Ruminococcus sp.]